MSIPISQFNLPPFPPSHFHTFVLYISISIPALQIGSSVPALWAYTLRKPWFKRLMHPNVHCSTIYNGQDMEATSMNGYGSCDTCTMEYYSVIIKNEIMLFAATWMDLETVILSEISQKRRNILWHSLHVESINKKKYKINLFTKQKQTHTLGEWTL